MKKGIILLLTLFFISAFSLLVLKNLNDTDTFLEKQNYVFENTQLLLAIKNAKDEVQKLIKENKDDIDDILNEQGSLAKTFTISDGLELNLNLNNYEKIDINEINNPESKSVENLFISHDNYDYILFEDIFKKKFPDDKTKLETSKQLNAIINDFIISSYDPKYFKNIQDELGFINKSNLYELNVDVSYNNTKVKAYYILTNDEKVEYFDISFN